LDKILQIIKKDFLVEWRSKYILPGTVLYVVSSVYVAYLSFKKIISVNVWAALFWVILLFACVNLVSNSFSSQNKARMLYQYTLMPARTFILSKIIYNALIMLMIGVISLLVFSGLLGNPVQDMLVFIFTLVFGSIGLSGVFTLISAIASKTGNGYAFVAILGFPIVLPLLMIIIKLTKNALDGIAWEINLKYMVALMAVNTIVVVLAYLLFPYLWRD
jgi:heme exporter protein B